MDHFPAKKKSIYNVLKFVLMQAPKNFYNEDHIIENNSQKVNKRLQDLKLQIEI